MLFLVIYIFLVGIIIGSFMNVCVYRIPRKESIAFPPSHCPKCNKKIKGYDLIPVVSYVLLGGKCRNCGDKISIRYPIVEFVNGIIYIALLVVYGLSTSFVLASLLSSLILVLILTTIDSWIKKN